jgi:4-amino-4-deoxy-L-arabinose transferase-like glycosyltransferase
MDRPVQRHESIAAMSQPLAEPWAAPERSARRIAVTARRLRWPRLDAQRVCLLVLLAVMAGALILVPPFGEFAVDDDWVYAQAVHQLLTDGVYRPSIWIDTSFFAQAWWGAAASYLLGFSYTSLRLSTLLLAGIALVLYYRVLCRSLRPALALLTTLLLLFHPLVFHLSYTFMTDIPFLAVVLAAIWCMSTAFNDVGRIRLGWLAAGSGLVGLACLVRQIGIVLVPVVLLGMLPEARTSRSPIWRVLGAFVVPCGAVLLGASLLDAQPHDVTVDTRLVDVLAAPDPATLWTAALRVAALAVASLGISVTPIAPLLLLQPSRPYHGAFQSPRPTLPPSPARRRGGSKSSLSLWERVGVRVVTASLLLILGYVVGVRGSELWYGAGPALLAATTIAPWPRVRLAGFVGATAATIAAAIVSGSSLSPLFGNTLWAAGFTTSGLHPQAIAVSGAPLTALVAGSLLGAMALILAVVDHRQLDRLPISLRLLLLSSLGILVVTLGYEIVDGPFNGLYDRYLIPVLPGALAACAYAVRNRRLAVPVLAVGVVLFAGWSVGWQREYMQRQTAIWQLAQTIVESGVPPSQIGAGFEWNGTYRSETVIPEARDAAILAGDPRQFVQRVIDGIYRPRRWSIDFEPPPPTTCPDQQIIQIEYGNGWPVYGVRRCFGPRPQQTSSEQASSQ